MQGMGGGGEGQVWPSWAAEGEGSAHQSRVCHCVRMGMEADVRAVRGPAACSAPGWGCSLRSLPRFPPPSRGRPVLVSQVCWET